MDTLPKSRFCPTPLTVFFLLCVTGGWTWLNLVETEQYWGYEASAYRHHGFPCDAAITYNYEDMSIHEDKRVKFGFETQTVSSSDGEKYCCDVVTPCVCAVLVPSGIVIDVLFGLGLSIGAIVLSKLLSSAQRRGWLKLHLSTAALLTVVSGLLLGLNMRPDRLRFYYGFPRLAVSPYVLDGEVSEGYPGVDVEEPMPFNFTVPIVKLSVIFVPLVEDVLFATGILTATAVISECIIRRREASKAIAIAATRNVWT